MEKTLMGYGAENLSELLVRIQVILRAMPGEPSVRVFLEWMKQLQRCIDITGEYSGSTTSDPYIRINFILYFSDTRNSKTEA
jgi:hypothetical protein